MPQKTKQYKSTLLIQKILQNSFSYFKKWIKMHLLDKQKDIRYLVFALHLA